MRVTASMVQNVSDEVESNGGTGILYTRSDEYGPVYVDCRRELVFRGCYGSRHALAYYLGKLAALLGDDRAAEADQFRQVFDHVANPTMHGLFRQGNEDARSEAR